MIAYSDLLKLFCYCFLNTSNRRREVRDLWQSSQLQSQRSNGTYDASHLASHVLGGLGYLEGKTLWRKTRFCCEDLEKKACISSK